MTGTSGRDGRPVAPDQAGPAASDFVLRPIGTLHTPWRTIADCPRNGRQPDPAPTCTARVLPEFTNGLRGLEGFSHLILLYWLGTGTPPRLVFTPPFDTEPRGVFSTRAPFRPNPIGLSVVVLDGFDGVNELFVRYLDCVDGTPLLDIKPYLATTDSEPDAAMGWLDPHATRNRNTGSG
ncbi:tRNA (N6-threonylcarbamoyladenosine(37)-N6)-methyltransferase TrmO [Rhodopila sp.]|jgi:tRNA-Thr(GGU) m(6)t(6)A37 methyltransferase TsaA|uniref:tRNA (N6-threonylcarbamoyladenosine(37)-N6)-methyltransferase TrmO n=1 Tax=Rhodopila sp. TaxID=2480087 RepID=UPI002C44E5A2|nr:tRNA (N6-threonylcarbamoyladenosine(37)-N6)-methyltransferase TrmO [Rhodopila sp.]HVZ07648.1 tRNA (N6-threonylcarbamoyladenosine(37)-N6)-methyltransferase TrmO [Rhodopila sp.]